MVRKNRKKGSINKESKRKHVLLFFIIIIIFSCLGYSFVTGEMGLTKYLMMRKTRDQILNEIKDVKKKNQDLRKSIEALENDPVYVEGIAREKLGMVKRGEVVYLFK